MAAGRHNDSSQMRESLRYNESPEKKTKSDAENGSKDFRGEASGSSSSCPRDVRGSQARADEAVQWEKSSLTCQLKDMRRLPQCRSRLGPLSHGGTHTVLIDVRFHFLPSASADRTRVHHSVLKKSYSSISILIQCFKSKSTW